MNFNTEFWKQSGTPPALGENRAAFVKKMHKEYGNDWNFAWKYGSSYLDFNHMTIVYEMSYFHHFETVPELWHALAKQASDVYDNDRSNIYSGIDYTKQESGAHHLQDIAIRKVLKENNVPFTGDFLIQVRNTSSTIGRYFSPGVIAFAPPGKIETTKEPSWYLPDSLEAWYQNNRRIMVRK